MHRFEIKTPLGHAIEVTRFNASENGDIVVLCSATGVLQKYYAKFASFLSNNGCTVYTFDYSGIGFSKKQNLRKFDVTLSNWATNDIKSVFEFIKTKHSQQKIHCICHSIGGQLLGIVPNNNIFKNIIFVTVQNINHSMWKGFGRVRTFFNYYFLIPVTVNLVGYLPSKKFMKMENLPKSMALEFASWGRKKNHVFAYKEKDQLFYSQIKSKITSYSTENDHFAPKKAVDWMTRKYNNAFVVRKHLKPQDYEGKQIGHFGFFKAKFEHSIWQEFLSDLQA